MTTMNQEGTNTGGQLTSAQQMQITEETMGAQQQQEAAEVWNMEADNVTATQPERAMHPVEQGQSQQNAAAHMLPVPPAPRKGTRETEGQQRAAGSSQRKRSRLGEDGGYSSGNACLTKIHEQVNAINFHIDNFQHNGAKANTATARQQLADAAKGVLIEAMNLMAKVVNSQEVQLHFQKAEKLMRDRITVLLEENTSLRQQIIELQAKTAEQEMGRVASAPTTYMDMAIRNLGGKVQDGRLLPIPHVAEGVRHAPSECIIVFKAKEKGEMLTKQQQEKFRADIKFAIGEELLHNISAIRPTRFGGHTIIFQTERQRDEVYEKLKLNERTNMIPEEESCMVAPRKKVSKAVCKEPPSDISIEEIRANLYGKHNPAFEHIPQRCREGKVIRTRLGVIFEFSGAEMQAAQVQGWRIRGDLGRELRIEEFIPLQQCYACCKFGHNADECKAGCETCRLCGMMGHTGKNCPSKDDRDNWRCANCQRMNLSKNLHLDDHHAAAQLHKCPVAQQQKAIRKMQLASSGVYTTPIIKGSDQLGNEGPIYTNNQQSTKGAQQSERRGNYQRSKSRQERNPRTTRNQSNTRYKKNFSTTSSAASTSQTTNEGNKQNPCVEKPTKGTRPPSTDGWQTVGRRSGVRRSGEEGRGRENRGQVGVNSMTDVISGGEDERLRTNRIEQQSYDE